MSARLVLVIKVGDGIAGFMSPSAMSGEMLSREWSSGMVQP
jgi:hypothetical protein